MEHDRLKNLPGENKEIDPRHYFELAVTIGGVLREADASQDIIDQAVELIIKAQRTSRLMGVQDLIGRLSLYELYKPPPKERKALSKTRSFLEKAYPGGEISELSDMQIQRISRVLHIVVRSSRQNFAPKMQMNLEKHLRNLERWIGGDLDSEISVDESVARNTITVSRKNFARNLSKAVEFSELLDSAQALEKIEAARILDKQV